MIFAHPAQKINPGEAGKKHPILGESIIRVRLLLPGEEVETVGQLACPVYVVNEDPNFAQSEWFLDADEPVMMVLRYDLPATGLSAIPVWVVDGETEDAWGVQVQGSEAEEDERQGDPAQGQERSGEDWQGSAQGLSENHSDLGTPAKVYSLVHSAQGQ